LSAVARPHGCCEWRRLYAHAEVGPADPAQDGHDAAGFGHANHPLFVGHARVDPGNRAGEELLLEDVLIGSQRALVRSDRRDVDVVTFLAVL
jgi:hypothetical protein